MLISTDNAVMFQLVDAVLLALTVTVILLNPNINGAAAGLMLTFAGSIGIRVEKIFTMIRDFQVKELPWKGYLNI